VRRSDANTLKIGFMGDLTGENSGIVIPPRNGARMAFDAYNATNPPKKIEMSSTTARAARTRRCRWSPRRSSRTRSSG